MAITMVGNIAVLSLNDMNSGIAEAGKSASFLRDFRPRVLVVRGDYSCANRDAAEVVKAAQMPVIAAVESCGTDGGRELAGLCDLRVLAEDIAGIDGVAHAPADRVFEEAMKLAGTIAANSPFAVAWIKESIAFGMHSGQQDALDFEQRAFALTNSSPDKKIGMGAYLEGSEKKEFCD